MTIAAGDVFRSLRNCNYRLWAAGALVSNVGTWIQRTAQDWLVLTQLTHHSASAVGGVMALQFGPQLLFLPLTGFAADHFNQRRLLIATQGALGLCALALGRSPSPASSSSGTSTCSPSCKARRRPSTRPCAKPSSPSWSAGGATLTFTNATNSLMQLSTEPSMRGRVMALRVGIALGGTPIGAPIVGWVADQFGPRWALGVGAVSGFAAALVAVAFMAHPRD
jgi:MFS family permease